MILRYISQTFLAVICLLTVASWSYAQESAPTPPSQQQPSTAGLSQQEPVRVFTEEVIIPFVALDERAHFDPTLEKPDILLLEDGVPQEIKSLRRIAASVLLLLDTSGELNPAMKTNLTRDIATRLVSQLRDGDRVAAIQYGGRVESIQGWTTEKEAVLHTLKNKLFSGKGAHLTDALVAAASRLQEEPLGSRHVVLITDGTESSGDKANLAQAVKRLLAVQATVHVISYTAVGRKMINQRHPKYLITITSEKRKSAQDIANELVDLHSPETLDTRLKRKIYLVIESDFRLWRLNRKYVKALKENELWLASLAEESGGLILLPKSSEEIVKQADAVARDVDAQYVITYRPKRPLALATKEEYRRIEVAPRRAGLQVRGRRGYVVPTLPQL
jgi:VWFA-related protein